MQSVRISYLELIPTNEQRIRGVTANCCYIYSLYTSMASATVSLSAQLAQELLIHCSAGALVRQWCVSSTTGYNNSSGVKSPTCPGSTGNMLPVSGTVMGDYLRGRELLTSTQPRFLQTWVTDSCYALTCSLPLNLSTQHTLTQGS